MSIGDVEVVTTLDGAVRPPTAPALAAAAAPGTGHPCNKFIFKLLIEYYLLNLQALNVNVSGGCPTQGGVASRGRVRMREFLLFLLFARIISQFSAGVRF